MTIAIDHSQGRLAPRPMPFFPRKSAENPWKILPDLAALWLASLAGYAATFAGLFVFEHSIVQSIL